MKMFGDSRRRAARSGNSVETLIGPKARIRGDLEFSGGLYVEGTVEGSVVAEKSAASAVLTLAEGGRIEGEVHAPVVILSGHLQGDVYASERIELGSTARVEGNIHYSVVEMAAGAMLTGRLIHTDSTPRQLTGPDSSSAD